MAFLDNIYQEIILEHYRKPRNHGRPESFTVSREGLNPSCGDELELFLDIAEGRIVAIGFNGEGCAISQASASMMTEAVKGRSGAEALALAERFREMVRGAEPHESLGDLKLLKGISKLHARVKCATLAWVTLEEALGAAEEG